ncbi:MAG: uroporphyrinogen decarboxylase family protein [Eubacteriales bacterium]|nr:uroporphyrinogen decarboxylase family protein [Eubacteriales bacterium]
MTNEEKYNERLKRVEDAIAMKKTDRVPCMPFIQTYPFIHNGHSMAEVMYDADKAAEDLKKYLVEYEPDMAIHFGSMFCGQGAMLEKLGINWLQWAGRPGCNVDKNSIHQFIEKPYLEDGEYPELLSDLSGWIMRKWLPRCFTSMESLRNINIPSMLAYQSISATLQFTDPKIVKTFQNLAEVGNMALEYYGKIAAYEQDVTNMGFPPQIGATTITAFDILSDTLRGTLESMADLYEEPDSVHRAVEMFYPSSLYGAVSQMQNSKGKFVFIPLHKGLDGFMGPQQYEEFYWPTLKRLVEDLINMGYTPWIYTEGKYDTRLETITDVPAGKVLFHFENVDMKEAKRIVGKEHCISGGFNSRILKTENPDGVREQVKRLLDVTAVDGGYIFDLSDTLDEVPHENVEAMFDAVKTYGRY